MHTFDQASRLASPAKICDLLIGADHRNGRATARAGLSGFHMDRHKIARLLVDIFMHLVPDVKDGVI